MLSQFKKRREQHVKQYLKDSVYMRDKQHIKRETEKYNENKKNKLTIKKYVVL